MRSVGPWEWGKNSRQRTDKAKGGGGRLVLSGWGKELKRKVNPKWQMENAT